MAAELKQFVRSLKERLPIEEVLGDYLPELRRHGRTWKARCPFHDEKTPSFTVNAEFGYFYCFGCQAKGDVIKFVQDFDKVDFMMAVETLARRAGIEVPKFSGPSGDPAARDRDEETRRTLRAICKAAAEFFVSQLRSASGSAARGYLEKRGITPEQITAYKLGFAPDGFDAFLSEAARRGYSTDRVIEAGLAVRNERGKIYDRFRNRVMFPIADQQGDIVAFGGRLMEGDGPKYLNSSDSPIFHKGKLLYGLPDSREAIRDAGSVILLEGYMDWIALHSNGVKNGLAGLGTAFGEDQARLLKRITREVILHYDGDTAGQKAMHRAAELLLAQGLKVRAAALPVGEDPDSFIRDKGPEATQELIRSAPSAIDFFTDQSVETFATNTPEGKAEAAAWLGPLLRAIPDPVLGDSYVRQVATRLAIDPDSLRRQSIRPLKPQTTDAPTSAGPTSIQKMEYYVLNRLLRCMKDLSILKRFEAEMFEHESARSMFIKLVEYDRDLREGGDPISDPFELCATEFERDCLTDIMFIEERLASGALRRNEEIAPTSLEEELDQLRLRLLWRTSRRRRGSMRASVQSGPLRRDDQEYHDTIHAIGQAIVRETETHFTKPNGH